MANDKSAVDEVNAMLMDLGKRLDDAVAERERLREQLAAERLSIASLAEQNSTAEAALAKALGLLRLLAECAPIARADEYEQRGEERIPCFIQVSTAKAIRALAQKE